MNVQQRVVRERRQYNKWAASETLEDYALRFTAHKARRWSAWRIAGTAIGATSFLACEAIGGTITLAYGFSNAVLAIATAVVLMFVVGLPVAYHAAKHGLDVDLLTRGAGFGYLGSTITSLIYASFTFLLFAIEASIMSVAIQMLTGMPLWAAHIFSSLIVIPIAIYGMSLITRVQAWTQPVWVVLQLAPVIYIAVAAGPAVADWSTYAGRLGDPAGGANLLLFGLALSTLLSLLPQIGEQADYLRFLPSPAKSGRRRWWAAMLAGGPGWVVIGGLKLLVGSFLALYALRQGVAADRATNPTDMFYAIFADMARSPTAALVLTAVFVIVCQIKINVTNAYAGSIAWSNFFSRLTHAHPGRVVWLVFNVLLALLLMEIGIFRVIEGILVLYANLAAGWMGALSADLTISKPLGLSPKGIEFKRAHLYDINPVGVGAMALSILISTLALVGVFGDLAQAFSPLLGLVVAFVAAPAIALGTRGRYYLARQSPELASEGTELVCTVCENGFDRADMAMCPAYGGPICSLCCTLEARCHDICKEKSGFGEQIGAVLARLLPERIAASLHGSIGHFVGVLLFFHLAIACVVSLIYMQYGRVDPAALPVVRSTLWIVFISLSVISGVAAWLIVLAHDSRRSAERETTRQTEMLMEEVRAHTRTDAALQKAKEAAEAANAAKSRYLVGVSHEIRSPLNAIFGYAQLLEREGTVSPQEAGRVIRRSSEHLTNLVEGLLDISRIESGVLKLSREMTQFPAFLDQVADMFRMQAAAKGLQFIFASPADLPSYVRTDQKRLRQILINLLSNAVKYTQSGRVELAVRYRSQIAEFTITDTGIGIRPEDRERIFEAFERGGMADASLQRGVGLGLAITRVLVQIMGGEIKVTSTPGKGSRFTVRMMLPEPLEHPAESVRQRRIAGYKGARRTLLLVDDDPAQIMVQTSLLTGLGFVVYSAGDGAQGIELARRCKPDLVMLDIQMPGISGWEVAAALRREHNRRFRIVMVSANAHDYRAGGDGEADHDAFVMKPVEFEALLDVLAEQLRLDWEAAVPAIEAAPALVAVGLPGDARPFVTQLAQLGRIGHVRGLEAKLSQLEEEVPEAEALVAKMRQLVRVFDLKTLLVTLNEMTFHD